MKTGHFLLWSSCAAALLAGIPSRAGAQEQQILEDLRGKWKFQIGDDAHWSRPSLDDAKWDDVAVPSPWEDQGYPGYDGYAWYRKHFVASEAWQGRSLRLRLGRIDDADEVYVNGNFIGFCGQFPPHYVSEYGTSRDYYLPEWCLRIGAENVIAIRVYDSQLSGGITDGPVGIYALTDPLLPTQSLAGTWKLKQGDDPSWNAPGLNDASWHDVVVPLYWETQGLKDYDGFGWYRLKFIPTAAAGGKTMILLLGKIDDVDEAFLNGEKIGHTGSMSSRPERLRTSNDYKQLRAYTIPGGLLKPGEENVLAVRVFDAWLHGGIYDAPVGLITRDAYMAWKDRHKDRKAPWDFWKKFFE